MFQFYYDQESIYTVRIILKLWNILGQVPYLTLKANMVTRRIPYIPMQNLGHKIGHCSALLQRIMLISISPKDVGSLRYHQMLERIMGNYQLKLPYILLKNVDQN